ncbi:hypothetical protein SAMN03080617_02867 [Algoriphagus alkaliphilus]|uniref:Uncharacterized protein n=2 Tax=Algoriphagus alkaliphilus TaxID=279824 RepID=A0A1G5YVG0_9BACT|nr:hypothetical protein [Algoriphagus alkaliphilus]SDA86352.1 hypothetical protein SAMN03080617_02867 [Algoriphagus alkaliphilus]
MRYVGDLDQTCSKVLLLPGAVGGRGQIESIMKEKPDVLVCGESNEGKHQNMCVQQMKSG